MSAAAQEGTVDAGPGVRLFYRQVGSGPQTIVVLHGGPGFSMEYLADDLAPLARRHRVLFYDQRGTGRSTLVNSPEALDAQRFAEDLEALRRHFKLEQLTLLGHSWGAGVAALYALRYPERVTALIIVGGMPLHHAGFVRTFEQLHAGRDPQARERLQQRREAWLADPGDAFACRAYYDVWFEPFVADRATALPGKGDFCAGTPQALRNKIDAVDRYTIASLGEWDWRGALGTVPARSLVVHGTRDVIAVDSARQWAGALANARLLLFDGVGHFPYLEAPERFFGAIEAFMQGDWPEDALDVAACRL